MPAKMIMLLLKLKNNMEHAIGTRITLEVVEVNSDNCDGCYFSELELHITDCARKMKCADCYRTDCKNVIFKEIK